MWKVYICWRDEELPVKIRSDATVGSLAWLISSKTDGKLQADRCELTFGVTKLASVPSQELLATIGVVQGARFGLTLRPKGAMARQAPSPVLSLRAKASAKARLAAARAERKAEAPSRRGQHLYEPEHAAVLLTEEVTGSLRTLAGSHTLLRDRLKSLQRRELVEPRVRQQKVKSKSYLKYEPGAKGEKETEMHESALKVTRETSKMKAMAAP